MGVANTLNGNISQDIVPSPVVELKSLEVPEVALKNDIDLPVVANPNGSEDAAGKGSILNLYGTGTAGFSAMNPFGRGKPAGS